MQELILKKLETIESLLINQNEKPLSFREAHEYLGISLSYLYKLTSQNKIPHFKPNGKIIYFSKAELDQWIMRNPVKAEVNNTEIIAGYATLNQSKISDKN